MRDIVYNVFDIISYFVQGMLLVTLLKEAQPHFPFKKYHSAAILLGQYVAVQIFLHYSVFIKSLLYGKSMVMNNSRQSILPVLISMLVICVAGIFFVQRKQTQNHLLCCDLLFRNGTLKICHLSSFSVAAYKAGRSESIFISGQADVWRNHVF